MFKRSFSSKDRAGKSVKPAKKTIREYAKVKLLQERLETPPLSPLATEISPTSLIVTLVVGRDQRLFAAHEDVLSTSPFFRSALRCNFFDTGPRRLDLPDEEPEIVSCVLEYLYKGDYYPRLLHNQRSNTWELEDSYESSKFGGRGPVRPTMTHPSVDAELLRDTVVYCTAEKFGLAGLKDLAVRKQGLQSGMAVDVILRSARYAYENTPDTDSRLRAHYLALVIRSRKTFKRSGTMQMEMEIGGKFFFDLFVAMCNHIDDIVDMSNGRETPRTI